MSFFNFSPLEQNLSLDRLLIKNQQATFFWRNASRDFIHLGITCGDILIVDRSLDCQKKDLVIAVIDDSFILTEAKLIKESQEVWGIVTGVVKCLRL